MNFENLTKILSILSMNFFFLKFETKVCVSIKKIYKFSFLVKIFLKKICFCQSIFNDKNKISIKFKMPYTSITDNFPSSFLLFLFSLSFICTLVQYILYVLYKPGQLTHNPQLKTYSNNENWCFEEVTCVSCVHCSKTLVMFRKQFIYLQQSFI